MNTSHESEDYRRSHLHKGADYDAALATAPFDRFMARQESRLLNALLDQYFPQGVPAYLDFACGTGRITAQVEPRAKQSYGVDVSEQMIAEARQKCRRTTFFVQDITHEPLQVRDLDLITSFRFFGNAQPVLRQEVLAAALSILRPGGYLLINNHRNSDSIRNLLLRLTGQPSEGELSHFKLRRLLHEAGFEIVKTWGVGTWIIRATLRSRTVLESPKAERFERITRLPFVAPISPDVIVLARRRA